eukprot:SAG11_NODE_29132_length_314_cov_0.720930_1_plen_51_part_10
MEVVEEEIDSDLEAQQQLVAHHTAERSPTDGSWAAAPPPTSCSHSSAADRC